ncbi:MAG: hypothetical protein J7L45_01280 [Candidatus Aenigmarchaeota archaeon]|nr:hypothetical protein [Candidatus Aenigmarchaeota archaeon]
MKGQSQVIVGVLLVLIMIILVGVTYFWGIPLIQKQKDVVTVSNTERFLKDLNDKIQDVAKNGGTRKITVDIPGELILDDKKDMFILTFKTTGDIIATNTDIYLVGDERKEVPIGDEPGVILVRSRDTGKKYNITERLYYRNLTGGTSGGKQNKYKIDLIGLGKSTIGGNNHEITIREFKSEIIETPTEKIYVTKVYVRME